MEFKIEPTSRQAIYRQLSEQIREAIATGRLAEDEKLPSVRELSRTLVVNPNTIARVYTELEREGVLLYAARFGRVRRTAAAGADQEGSPRPVGPPRGRVVDRGGASGLCAGRSHHARRGTDEPLPVGAGTEESKLISAGK